MNDGILIAMITASASIIVAALTFHFTKRHELKEQWRYEKINHYKVLFSAISDLACDGTDKTDANYRFALAVNTVALVAPQYVIKAIIDFHDEVKFSNQNPSNERHNFLLKELLRSVRRDIGRARGDNSSFDFHLIGSSPPSHHSK